jgi:hypothetical protein
MGVLQSKYEGWDAILPSHILFTLTFSYLASERRIPITLQGNS